MPPCRRVSSPSPTRRQHDATVYARPISAHRPHRFLATGHRPLATIHYPLQCRNPVPPSPARDSETCYTARLNLNAIGLDPNAPHAHNYPSTLPRPPAMSTCSELNLRVLPQAHLAPGAAATNPKCAHLPSAAPPTRSGTRRAIPPMPALPPPASVSCHKEHSATTVLRTFCTQTPSFAHFQSKTDRELTAAASCYESPCQYPVTRTKENFSKSGPFGQIYTIRYPIDTLPIPDFRKIRSRFASHPDAFRPKSDRIGPTLAHLRGAADKETDAATDSDPDFGTRRRCGPRRGPLLARKSGRLHPCRRRIRCRKPPFSNGRISSTCPAPMTTFGRCSLTAPGYQANNGAKTLPDIPIPLFGMHPTTHGVSADNSACPAGLPDLGLHRACAIVGDQRMGD